MKSRDEKKIVFLITIFAIGGFFIILLNIILTNIEVNDYESLALKEVKESVLYKYYSDEEVVLRNVERQDNKWTYTYEFNNAKESLDNIEKYLYYVTIEEGIITNVKFAEVTA